MTPTETAWNKAIAAAWELGHHGGDATRHVARTAPPLYAAAIREGVIVLLPGMIPPGAAAPRTAPALAATPAPAPRPQPAPAATFNPRQFVPSSPAPARSPAMPATSPAPTGLAAARWRSAVDEVRAALIARGIPPLAAWERATEQVDRTHPSLRQEMIREANSPRTTASAPAPVADALVDWRAAVDAEKARGLSATDAVLAADRKHPGLRQRMLAAVNPHRR
jgi:hypothetical protein